MIEINFGDTVEATCYFSFAGPACNYTFAQEIGDILTFLHFNTLDRWEQQRMI